MKLIAWIGNNNGDGDINSRLNMVLFHKNLLFFYGNNNN